MMAAPLGRLGLHLNQYPSGRWGFVGSVPPALAFEAPEGGPADPAEVERARRFGPRLARVRSRSWATRAEAAAEAAALGFETA